MLGTHLIGNGGLPLNGRSGIRGFNHCNLLIKLKVLWCPLVRPYYKGETAYYGEEKWTLPLLLLVGNHSPYIVMVPSCSNSVESFSQSLAHLACSRSMGDY